MDREWTFGRDILGRLNLYRNGKFVAELRVRNTADNDALFDALTPAPRGKARKVRCGKASR